MEGLSQSPLEMLVGSSLIALFAILLLKEIGVPVPVPSDLLMISAGVQAAAGRYTVAALLAAIAIAVFVGCSVQFLIVRSAGRRVVYRLGRFVGLPPERLDQSAERLRRRGPLAVFLGLNVPGVRAGIVIASGLAGIRYLAFAPAMLAGSMLYHGWHIALGYAVGPAATTLLERANLPLLPVVLGLAALGLIGWLLVRARRRGAPDVDVAARVHAWTESACPACLAISLIRANRPHEAGEAPSPL